jgi:hypothetical protein
LSDAGLVDDAERVTRALDDKRGGAQQVEPRAAVERREHAGDERLGGGDAALQHAPQLVERGELGGGDRGDLRRARDAEPAEARRGAQQRRRVVGGGGGGRLEVAAVVAQLGQQRLVANAEEREHGDDLARQQAALGRRPLTAPRAGSGAAQST